MRFILGLILVMMSSSVLCNCFPVSFKFLDFNPSTTGATAESDVIELDLNDASLNSFQSIEDIPLNFTGGNSTYHCDFGMSNPGSLYKLTARSQESGTSEYYQILTTGNNDGVYVEVQLSVNSLLGSYSVENSLYGFARYYFNFPRDDLNSKVTYAIKYRLTKNKPVSSETKNIGDTVTLKDHVRFNESPGSNSYNLKQNIRVKFNYTPTTCSFNDTTVKVSSISYGDVSKGLAHDADAEVKIDCDQTVAYATRSVHYRFVSDNAVGNVLPNEYTNSDSAGNIGFELIKDGSVVNLSNNRYGLIAWGDLKENVARNTIIPLKYKYTPYGNKIFKAGQVLSRVKIVIDYD